jgi:hypothetical protein
MDKRRENEMHKNFAEWYRIANIEPTSEQLNNRWEGIISFIENKISKDDIFELVKLFYGKVIKEEFRDKYIECFTDIDSAFDRKSEVELSVLAGATLIRIVEDSSYSMLAILSTMTSSFFQQLPVIPDIINQMKENFYKMTSSIRENVLVEDNVVKSNINSNELMQLLQTNPGIWSQNPTAVSTALSKYISESDKFFKALDKKEKQNKITKKVYWEDSQILWWMTGEWSNDLDKSFKEIKKEYASIIVGKELADKIEILPGPYSAKAVIYKVINLCNKKTSTKKTNLKDMIDNLDLTWRTMCLEKYNIDKMESVVPILFAISKSLTVDEGEEWNPQFKKSVGYSAEEMIKPIEDVAFQVYLECLTVKCYNNIEV